MSLTIDTKKRKFGRRMDTSNIFDYFSSKSFTFSKEILSRYFLSLKTKPFVILTGISGTGKTKIAQIFADYMCQHLSDEEKTDRIAFVPVRPDWMDNRGLLGFYNLITDRYVTEKILRLLIRAENDPDNPYFVILDEMNIAKVEYYFSDFLSLMESRTHDRPKGEPLILHNQGKAIEPSDNEEPIPERLHIPPNVFFTGTVNVDETTYMFSPKVLDRANVIEFNGVRLSDDKTRAPDGPFAVKDGNVLGKLYDTTETFSSQRDYNNFLSITDNGDNPLLELLHILERHNLHFGYRVANEIARFICHAGDSIQHFQIDDALDIQFLQKILPKFHGTRGKLEKPLMDIFKFCCDIDDEVDINVYLDSQDRIADVRFPRTGKKVAIMIKDLQSQGYTSFIS